MIMTQIALLIDRTPQSYTTFDKSFIVNSSPKFKFQIMSLYLYKIHNQILTDTVCFLYGGLLLERV